MKKTLEVRLDAKTIAKNLVAMCGTKKEAMSTIIEGARNLPTFGNLLYNVSIEVACVRESSQDAYRLVTKGRDRKGGSPRDRRFL